MAIWATCGQSGYSTPAVLGVPKAQRGNKNQKLLGALPVSKVATSPMPSWGSPTLSAGTKSKKKCFSIALGHTLVVLEMH